MTKYISREASVVNPLAAEVGVGAMPTARATHEPSQLRRLGLTVGIAIALAGCGISPEQRERNRIESERRLAQEAAQRRYDDAYQTCINRVTGLFSAASIEVMRECQAQARAAK